MQYSRCEPTVEALVWALVGGRAPDRVGHRGYGVAHRESARAALGDGEDYELLFALPAEQAEQLVRDQPLTVPIRRIGTVISGEALRLIGPDGRGEPLQVPGWEHET